MRRRFFLLAAFAIVLIAGAALALYWVWAADQVSAAIARWTDEQRARGYEVAYGGPEIRGFPVKLAVRFTEPSVSAPQGWHWSGGAIAGEAAFWQPHTLRLDLPLRQALSAEWRGHRRELSLQAKAARGLIHLGRIGWLKAATVEMEQLALTERGGGTQGDATHGDATQGDATLRADALRYRLTRRPPTVEGTDDWTLLLNGETRGIVLPDGTPAPFGNKVERIAFDATLIGVIPKGAPAEALARWRDSGGLLEVQEISLTWGPLGLKAEGTVALDQQLRPQGAFAARIRGLPDTLDALAARGLIDSGVALTLKFTALTLANRRDETGAAVVELPITLQDGLLYLGPVALFRLAPVL
jgi:hypothetical protein